MAGRSQRFYFSLFCKAAIIARGNSVSSKITFFPQQTTIVIYSGYLSTQTIPFAITYSCQSPYSLWSREYGSYVTLFRMMCRISFIYGLLWEHENLTPLTHDTLHEFFGYVTAEVSKQLALTMRKKKLVSASGEDIYLPDVDKKDRLESSAYREHISRLNLPICFIVGKRP